MLLRSSKRFSFVILLLCGLIEGSAYGDDRADYSADIEPLLQKHCSRCHGDAQAEAGFRVDRLSDDFQSANNAKVWLEVMDRVNAGEMPPRDEPQPDSTDISLLTTWIAGKLDHRDQLQQSTDGRVVLRRINRHEYNNTIRDLIGIDFKPADDFPEDPPAFGFDNIGSALTISPLQMEQYIAAARQIMDHVIMDNSSPEPVKWRFKLAELKQNNAQWVVNKKSDGRDHGALIGRLGGDEIRNDMITLSNRDDVVIRILFPVDGEYIVRIRAASSIPTREQVIQVAKDVYQKRYGYEPRSPEKEHFEEHGIYNIGPPRLKLTRQPRDDLRFDVTAPIEQPEIYERRATFAARNALRLWNVYHLAGYITNSGINHHKDVFPTLLIDWIEIEGPMPPEGQGQAMEKLLSPDHQRRLKEIGEAELAKRVIRRFMNRAWRRPVTEQELNDKLALFDRTRSSVENFEQAIKIPLIAILGSPHFLFLSETDHQATSASKLSDWVLASRLSYFLWSSMPDDELFRLARDGRLSNDTVLRSQIDRMLKDPKSIEFARNFAGQWLGFRSVGANPPVQDYFHRYDYHLQTSMVRESESFFKEILDQDLDVTNFIKSDFVMINERLARFYGIAGVTGDHIRRVTVPDSVPRGGALTQGSVLAVTSNGTRTSPVLRGKWILDNILGEPPSPPPPDVDDIAPKVEGASVISMRKRLELHQKATACASCHKKIDPLGFALENFRGDGEWAARERPAHRVIDKDRYPLIDASGELIDGRTFNGVDELLEILIEEEDKFLKCLSEKLATYALGRGLEYTDRAWIGELTTDLKSKRTLRSLIHNIVLSESFRSK